MSDWYWCLQHDRAEQGSRKCRAANRLGPYPTKEAATDHRETHEAREDRWEEQDEAWDGKDDDA